MFILIELKNIEFYNMKSNTIFNTYQVAVKSIRSNFQVSLFKKLIEYFFIHKKNFPGFF